MNQTLELSTATPSKTITVTNLKQSSSYDVYIFGLKETKQLQLYAASDLFKTLNVGDEAANPIIIKTTEGFLAMDAKKHYRLVMT